MGGTFLNSSFSNSSFNSHLRLQGKVSHGRCRKKYGRLSTGVLLVVLLFALSLFTACSQKDVPSRGSGKGPNTEGGDLYPGKSSGKMKVVTTILPLYDVVKNVGGDEVEVINLLPAGGSPHTFEPAPTEVQAVSDAELLVKLGMGLDDWLDKIAGDAGKKTLTASSGVKTIKAVGGGHDHHDADKDEHHESSEGDDPHIWMDPNRMIVMAGNVKDALVGIRPEKEEVFKNNYDLYVEKLKTLDKKYSDTLGAFKKKDFVTFHSILTYTADRYGMVQAAVVVDSPGKQPDPARLMTIIESLKKRGVKVVFVEPQFSSKASETIASEIGGEVMVIDPMGSLKDPKRDTYVKNMEENLSALKKAFETEGKDN